MKFIIYLICLIFSLVLQAYDENDLTTLKKTKKCENCDLTNPNLSKLDLSNAMLSGANLSLANLTNTNFFKADLSCSSLVKSKFI